MSWVAAVRRRLLALFGWLRGRDRPVPRELPPDALAMSERVVHAAPASSMSSPDSAATPAAPPLAATSVAATPDTATSTVATSTIATPVAATSTIATPVAATSTVATPVAAAARGQVTLDATLGGLNVRQFFGRMIAATPAGLTIDFSEWQSASVERFFMAMTAPQLLRRREPPTSGDERLSLTNAFQGFEWD